MVNLYNYIVESGLFKKMEVDDLLFAEYKCLINEERGEVWSHNNYFAFGIQGKKMWQTGKGKYLVEPGKLLFIKKGANVVYQYFEEDFLVLFIFITDEFIKNVIDKHGLELNSVNPQKKYDSIIQIQTDEILNAYFHSLFSYFIKTKPPGKSLLKLKVEELIINLLINNKNQEIIKCFREIRNKSKISVKDIMEENFCSNLSLEEFSRLCARSLSTFKRDFYNIYKTSPGKWLTEKRLEHSRFLIKNTNNSIDEIMYDSGFINRSHFVKIFKDKYGITPNKFRASKRPLKKVV